MSCNKYLTSEFGGFFQIKHVEPSQAPFFFLITEWQNFVLKNMLKVNALFKNIKFCLTFWYFAFPCNNGEPILMCGSSLVNSKWMQKFCFIVDLCISYFSHWYVFQITWKNAFFKLIYQKGMF
jgi:hypothetical protein